MPPDKNPVAAPAVPPGSLPEGVELRALRMHEDDRGAFTEIYREEWRVGFNPIQWNLVSSEAGVLRGVHVHFKHWDYLVIVKGRASIGLRDLRPQSSTYLAVALLECRGHDLTAVTIPPGVAHGFFFHEPSTHMYSVSEYWNTDDECGCHWADPDLGIPWPCETARVSPRDAALPTLKWLVAAVPAFRASEPPAPARAA